MRKSSRKAQAGVETLELVAVVPVFLIFMLIFVNFGLAMSNTAMLTEASRAAAREVIRGESDADACAAAEAVWAGSYVHWGGDGIDCTIQRDCDGNSVEDDPGESICATVTTATDAALIFVPSAVLSGKKFGATAEMRMLPH